MTTERHGSGLIGASIRRVEDPVLVTGKGCYTDDIQLPGMLHMAVLRSPHPHAKITSIDAAAAKAMAGVEAVLTGNEIGERVNVPVPAAAPGMKIPPHPPLARGAVHAAGTPVAAVAARTRALANDGANAIHVEYEPLPTVTDAEKALEPGAPLAREELDSNVCFTATRKSGDVEKAFAEADHICRMHIASPRLVAMALEPRRAVARPEPTGDLTLWLSTQAPHRARADLATALGFPEHRIRVIAPDVGGGFGSKGPLYREYILIAYLALKLGRPVKWIASRSEDFVGVIQGRDQAMTSELALKKDGTMLGLK
ncbi:MAG: xanthine dehydrogenase family protein molybdopterin-binding subunit, partial [Deltaproteobacteria bacterium]|nr:xanthine dehydrogenase family protein molybdopterin-binding subunit [Deltaproteobacteria bacterium]